MAKRYSRHVSIYYGGYDPGTATTQSSVTLQAEPIEKTVFGEAAETFVAGVRADEGEWAGLFDDSNSMDAAASALGGSIGTNTVFTWMCGTISGTLSTAIGYSAQIANIDNRPFSENVGLVRQSAGIAVDGTWSRGNGILLETISGTATGNTNAHDNGGATTAGGTVYVHVTTGTYGEDGTGTAILHLDHSTSGTGTWASIATMGGINTNQSILATFSGTVRQFTRIRMINAGSSITVAANVARS